jgi:thiamine biosynthesis lipoprotein
MSSLGFTRHYQTGAESPADPATADATFRDVRLDVRARTVTLARPVTLDLGGVAKGLAIDLAAHDLAPWTNFAINAGGDLYFAGHNAEDRAWRCGVRHPRDEQQLAATLHVSDRAVCTSGDYERPAPEGGGHHLVDPRTGRSATSLVSATVLAESAMLADALATAAFVLGADDAIELFARTGVDGMVIDTDLRQWASPGWSGALLPHA